MSDQHQSAVQHEVATAPGRQRVASFYKFVSIVDLDKLRSALLERCRSEKIFGTILLASEGINGTVAGPPTAVSGLIEFLRTIPGLSDLEFKEAFCATPPFLRMKVRLKKEIVTMGLDGVSPTVAAGTYVDAKEWNALLRDPDVILIDTRNDYEIDLGRFPGATNPSTQSFKELPQWLDRNLDGTKDKRKKIAMYCTGGIRCEKSTALLRSRGFESVYHLKGGILKYLESVDDDEDHFEGECFVFDERVSVTSSLAQGSYVLCRGCRMPVSQEQQCSLDFQVGISCPHCIDDLTPERRESLAERQRQSELAAMRNERHVGACFPTRPRATKESPDNDRMANLSMAEEIREESLEKSRDVAGANTSTQDLPTLYSFRRCPYAMRARMAILAGRRSCEIREVVLRDKPQSLIQYSPKGEVPVLVVGDRVIDQSIEIMLWSLREDPAKGNATPHPWLRDQRETAVDIIALIQSAESEFKFHLDRYKYASRYPGAVAHHHRSYAALFLQRLHARLLADRYLAGLQISIADIALFPFVRQFANTDRVWFDAQPWRRLVEWLDELCRHSLFEAAMKKYPAWKEGDEPTIFGFTSIVDGDHASTGDGAS